MSRSRLCRALLLFTLVLVLATPWANAMDRVGALAPGAEEPSASSPLRFLASLWTTLTHAWAESGCILDPFGVNRCAPSNPVGGAGGPSTEEESGCEIDPFGVTVCSPAPSGGSH